MRFVSYYFNVKPYVETLAKTTYDKTNIFSLIYSLDLSNLYLTVCFISNKK